jgi:hypothetical protein
LAQPLTPGGRPTAAAARCLERAETIIVTTPTTAAPIITTSDDIFG